MNRPAPASAQEPTSAPATRTASYTHVDHDFLAAHRQAEARAFQMNVERERSTLEQTTLPALAEERLGVMWEHLSPREKAGLLRKYRESSVGLTREVDEALTLLLARYATEQRHLDEQAESERQRLIAETLPRLAYERSEAPLEKLSAYEQLSLLRQFETSGATHAAPVAQALRQLQSELSARVERTRAQKEVERKSLLSQARIRLTLAKILRPSVRKLMSKVSIATTLRRVSARVLGKVKSLGELVRSRWSRHIRLEDQNVFSVYKDEENGQTVFHLDSAALGTCFVTIPSLLDSPSLRDSVLAVIKPVLRVLCGIREPVVIVDGDHQAVNYSKLLPSRIVLRCRSESTDFLKDRIDDLYSRTGLTPENTAIVGGIPASPEQLVAILGADQEPGGDSWDLWRGLHNSWKKGITQSGFSLEAGTDPRATLLEALQTKRNVIVAYAHSDGDSIFFPEPEPLGSSLNGTDLASAREGISTAKPLVYLLCCRTGQAANVGNLTEKLLAAGVAGVVAPQADIRADRSLRLLQSLLKSGPKLGPLAGLLKAANSSRYRELETWIG